MHDLVSLFLRLILDFLEFVTDLNKGHYGLN